MIPAMTLSTILLVLLLTLAVTGAVLALTSAVVRGDGRVGPGHPPTPPRSHPADVFEQSLRRLL
jgi:hypothetical protein